MAASLQDLIARWDGIGVVSRLDRATGTWIFVALHDTTLGQPVGGTRLKVYPTPADGLEDALRLAAGMTHKWAAVEIGYGGGKAVLALSRELSGDERVGLLERYARLLEDLRGAFATGQDLGTTLDDIAFLAQRSRWVHGYDHATGRARDPGPYTAIGVEHGMRAACASAFGSPELAGRTIAVQGLGGVGGPLVRRLTSAGAKLVLSDVDRERARLLAREHDAREVAPEDFETTPCDVLAPCALGATLNESTIPRLACRVVAGSANNQLREPADAERLHERGILYAPDYLVNAGGATAFAAIHAGVTDELELRDRLARLETITLEVLTEARERRESPVHAARRRVERVLAAAR
jgi:leucine dehydrogenase